MKHRPRGDPFGKTRVQQDAAVQARREAMLIPLSSYAQKTGYKADTIRSWIKKGWIPGAKKTSNPQAAGCMVWMIPEDAQPPVPRMGGRPRTRFGAGEEEAACKTEKIASKEWTKSEISLFIRKHAANMTYGEISRMLGISTLECRAIYDRLHRRYHI